jgi:hypothetical protein
MRCALTLSAVSFVLASATTALAWPVPNSPYRQGANHHVGDRSYVVAYGHAPGTRDREPDRMHAHLAYARALLASHKVSDPALAKKRAEILGYLDDYIAKGKTPSNEHVPWRTPVFIDEHGTICAVGYLIERSVGRALPEKIAAAHRYDYIEDIAKDMPEVADWVAASGFTLEEIATIQPAYSAPSIDAWLVWNLEAHHPEGAYDKHGWKGMFRHGQMEGEWTVADEESHVVVGRGTLHRGAGMWTSFRSDGTKLAEGKFARSVAHGPWKLFYPSGNVAAEGKFSSGHRDGKWSFYQDTADRTPIARGSFSRDWVIGKWEHFDRDGKLAAISRDETPDQWTAVDPDVGTDGGMGSTLEDLGPLHHTVHQGTVGGQDQRLETFAKDGERIYIQKAFQRETMFDANGFRLEKSDQGWQASDCHWASRRKAIAHEGDIARLHGLLYQDARRRAHVSGKDMMGEEGDDPGPTCGAPAAISGERAAAFDAMLASRDEVHAIPPSLVRDAVLKEEAYTASLGSSDDGDSAQSDEKKPETFDYASFLAENMRMYVEWPHIDGQFIDLFPTMPGRFNVPWYDRGEDSNAP